ncbi:hypothetical protein L1049_012100 [Liquidambar formosana]|uniref:MLO-like protein n=1 Tax=Liquidambar formosana TaxID=63359 RepID=A0AAP0RXL5_LIQFO
MGEEDSKLERSMEQTPTWAVAAVCFVLLAISIFIEQGIHHIGGWLKKRNKRALYEALEKIKAELMLLGFISLLLTVGKGPISDICIPKKAGNSWHPCNKKPSYKPKTKDEDKCREKDKVALVSSYAIYQLHKFIFVLAVFHVLYCITTLALGRTKMSKWKVWEKETNTIEYQSSHDPQRFRFTRDTSFGRKHLNFWSQSTVLLWIVSFFRQFFGSVDKVDYLTLRHGFITAHLAAGSETKFDFHKYISRSLEEDFVVVVGIRLVNSERFKPFILLIDYSSYNPNLSSWGQRPCLHICSPIIWLFAVLFLLSNTNGKSDTEFGKSLSNNPTSKIYKK